MWNRAGKEVILRPSWPPVLAVWVAWPPYSAVCTPLGSHRLPATGVRAVAAVCTPRGEDQRLKTVDFATKLSPFKDEVLSNGARNFCRMGPFQIWGQRQNGHRVPLSNCAVPGPPSGSPRATQSTEAPAGAIAWPIHPPPPRQSWPTTSRPFLRAFSIL